jgi:hypothetical protein
MFDVLAGITDDQLAGATPSDDLTVADLLGHVTAGESVGSGGMVRVVPRQR